MAEKPDDIEREIAERRRAISAKLDRLTDRVRGDLETARSQAQDRVPYRGDIDALVREHAFSSTAAAFGLGIALGGFTPSMSTMGSAASNGTQRGAAMGGGLMASLLEPVRQPIQDEVSRLVSQAVGGFAENGRNRANGHRADERMAEREGRS